MFDQWPLQRKAEQVTFVYLKLPVFHLEIGHSPQNLGGLERRSGKSHLSICPRLKSQGTKDPRIPQEGIGCLTEGCSSKLSGGQRQKVFQTRRRTGTTRPTPNQKRTRKKRGNNVRLSPTAAAFRTAPFSERGGRPNPRVAASRLARCGARKVASRVGWGTAWCPSCPLQEPGVQIPRANEELLETTLEQR